MKDYVYTPLNYLYINVDETSWTMTFKVLESATC